MPDGIVLFHFLMFRNDRTLKTNLIETEKGLVSPVEAGLVVTLLRVFTSAEAFHDDAPKPKLQSEPIGASGILFAILNFVVCIGAHSPQWEIYN